METVRERVCLCYTERALAATSVSKSKAYIPLGTVKSDDEGKTKGWEEAKSFVCFWLREWMASCLFQWLGCNKRVSKTFLAKNRGTGAQECPVCSKDLTGIMDIAYFMWLKTTTVYLDHSSVGWLGSSGLGWALLSSHASVVSWQIGWQLVIEDGFTHMSGG